MNKLHYLLTQPVKLPDYFTIVFPFKICIYWVVGAGHLGTLSARCSAGKPIN